MEVGILFSRTLIVYQYPLALPDVYRWAADLQIELEGNSPMFTATHGEEHITLIPSLYVREYNGPVDKLVMWGQFDYAALSTILEHIPVPVTPQNTAQSRDNADCPVGDNADRLRPMKDAPLDGTYILFFADSGYSTVPLRCEVCHYDAEYRPLSPWVNHSNDSFEDGGGRSVGLLPLPASDE